MPAAEQIDMFGQAAQEPIAQPAPIAATPAKSDPFTDGPDWPKLRDATDNAMDLTVQALETLRVHEDKIRNAHKAIELRRNANPPVPEPWLDKFKILISDRLDAARVAIRTAFIPLLNARIQRQLAAAAFMRSSEAVRMAPTKTGGKELIPPTDRDAIMTCLIDTYNQTTPDHLFRYVDGSSALKRSPLPDDADQDGELIQIDWTTDESQESYARLEEAQVEPVDVPELIAAANDYLKIVLRLTWAIRPRGATVGEAAK